MKHLSTAYKLLSKFHRRRLVPVILLLTLNSTLDFFSLASFLPLLMFIVTPEIISSNAYISSLYNFYEFQSQGAFIITLTVGVLVFVILKSLIGLFIARFKSRYAFDIGSDISIHLLTRYLQTDFTKFQQLDYSREINRISSHPIAFANSIILPITTIFSETLVALFIVAGVAYFDYRILLFFCVILLPVLFLSGLRKKGLKKIDLAFKEKYPLLLKSAYLIIEGFPEIKVFAKESFFKLKFKKANDEFVQTLVKDQTVQSGTTRFIEVIVGFIICSLIIYTITTQQQYQQTLLLLGLYAGASFRIVPSVNRIMLALQQIRTHEHVLEELKVPFARETVQTGTKHTPISFEEKVELNNISFQYKDGPKLLTNVTITIQKGEIIAITGKSGKGKTTLLLILLRFLKETSGHILVDGKLIEDDQAWRSRIGYVSQYPYVLDGTIAENIAFGVPLNLIDRAKVHQIIVELDLTELVEQLPHGIDSSIGERGVKLSGGQKQRIAIGRALYNDSDILLLDEVTNQVHASLEEEILNIMHRLTANQKTILIITHKISSPAFFDKIYRLENQTLQQASLHIS